MSAPIGMDELVTAATVGVGQRPVRPTALPDPAAGFAHVLSDDPASAVLDAVALLDVARRAGGFTPSAARLPAPAGDESQPALPAAAAALLADTLVDRRDLVAVLLHAAVGHAAPAALLPTLLAAATADTSLHGAVVGVLGTRGRWLAQQNPAWTKVLNADVPVVDVADEEVWRTGRIAERLAWLRALRATDPATARERLAASWTTETGDDRARLLTALRTELGPADEAFLEEALDDRKASVCDTARRLLALLPESAFVHRAVERARQAVHVERKALRRRLVVTLPPEPDAATRRDGMPTGWRGSARTASGGRGVGGWRLVHVIGATPLHAWVTLLDADPATIVGLATGEFADELLVGWQLAATRERSTEWARALLDRRAWLEGERDLVALLPGRDRLARALDGLRAAKRPDTLAGDLAAVAAPWPDELVSGVVDHVVRRVRAAQPDAPNHLLDQLGPRAAIPEPGGPDHASRLRELAGQFGSRPTGLNAAASAWVHDLEHAADALDLRHRFHRALHP